MFEFVCVGSTSMFCKNVEFLCVCRGKYGSHAQAQKGPSQACAEETAQCKDDLFCGIFQHTVVVPPTGLTVFALAMCWAMWRDRLRLQSLMSMTRCQSFDNVGERI